MEVTPELCMDTSFAPGSASEQSQALRQHVASLLQSTAGSLLNTQPCSAGGRSMIPLTQLTRKQRLVQQIAVLPTYPKERMYGEILQRQEEVSVINLAKLFGELIDLAQRWAKPREPGRKEITLDEVRS